MRVRLGAENIAAQALLPPEKADDSGVGINYADAYLKNLKLTLDDGRKVRLSRRGLKITLELGTEKGEGLLRRLEHGPDPREMLQRALEEAAAALGARFRVEDGALYLDLP